MPTVELHGRCSRPDDLPDVCAKCGADAQHHVNKTFNWYPPWIGVTILLSPLIYIVLAMILKKSYTVSVPFCKDHKSHWVNRVLLIVGSLFVVVGGGIGLAVLIGNMADGAAPQDRETYAMIAVFLVIGSIIAWLVVIVAAQSTSIRPKEITDHSIKLAGVAQAFVDAYEEQEDREREARRAARDRDDERRPRRRDEEDDRPRRRDDKRIQAEDEDDRPRRRDDKRIQGEDEDDRPRRPKREREEDY